MGIGKWICGFLGFICTGGSVLGALAGVALGSLFEAADTKSTGYNPQGNHPDSERQNAEGTRNSFLFSLLVLAAHVIQADGKIMHSELEYVRSFLRNTFGASAQEQGNEILLRLFDYRKLHGDRFWNQQISSACGEMVTHMPEEHRLQIVAFLAEIARADGHVDPTEVAAIREIAVNLRLSASVVDRMFALGTDSLDDAYKVLGVSPEATDDEVKQAYKKLALKHHPDRVANLGEDVKAAATKKFQEINKARDLIYKSRNLR